MSKILNLTKVQCLKLKKLGLKWALMRLKRVLKDLKCKLVSNDSSESQVGLKWVSNRSKMWSQMVSQMGSQKGLIRVLKDLNSQRGLKRGIMG